MNFNKLRAEDDTLLGKHRDELSSLQTQLSTLRGRFAKEDINTYPRFKLGRFER
jgi:hypothetical protein